MKPARRIAGAITALMLFSSLSFAILKPGDKLIPFSLKNIDGRDYTVTMEEGTLTLIVTETVGGESRVTKTHPSGILIDFWATWCVPCRKAMPHIQQLHETYKPAEGQTEGGLRVFGIALDSAGGKVVKPFFQKLKITYPLLADPPSAAGPAGAASTAKDMKKKYDVQDIPVVYVIDATGTIIHSHVGLTDEHTAELDRTLENLFGKNKR
jgi:thiol-disulfide isomerase/thioredoxin